MSAITKEFTKEQLQQIIETDHVQCGEASSLARVALASLEAEPVGEVSEQRDGLVMDGTVDLGGASTHRIIKGASKMKRLPLGTKFYTAPPAPVSVPDAMEMDDDFDSAFEHGKAVGWNAYRAAMLQGAEPVTKAYKLLDDFDFDRFNDVVWLEAVASNPHMHSLTTSTIAMVALELNRKLADRNSTVIQDGWVACSERLPPEGYEPDGGAVCYLVWHKNEVDCGPLYSISNVFFLRKHWEKNFTHWMPLPAAPQQE
ncbi:hypothetical protein STW0522ENT60_35470 [Enterobacter kobei]|uniref:DUF551 domain-containing protein n=1 Tax=Enterobacter kobei TaxID=208224 RepID=UPI0018A5837A|nr:DUF551 domain-containing protein [Enterobacter kobei]BBV82869.1 hypothetical protein STW0522ENT60_35470 [Enterobacter kobei]